MAPTTDTVTWMTGFGETITSKPIAEMTVNGEFWFVVEFKGKPRLVSMTDEVITWTKTDGTFDGIKR